MPSHHPHNGPWPGVGGHAGGLRDNGIQWIVVGLSVVFIAVGIASATAALWVAGVVHVLFGAAGWWMSRSVTGARSYLVCGGLLFLALTLTGVLPLHAAVQAAVAVAMVIGGLSAR